MAEWHQLLFLQVYGARMRAICPVAHTRNILSLSHSIPPEIIKFPKLITSRCNYNCLPSLRVASHKTPPHMTLGQKGLSLLWKKGEGKLRHGVNLWVIMKHYHLRERSSIPRYRPTSITNYRKTFLEIHWMNQLYRLSRFKVAFNRPRDYFIQKRILFLG